MNNNSNKTAWRLIAILGLILMAMKLYFSIIELINLENIFYWQENETLPVFFNPIIYLASCIGFLFLIIKPLSFRVYFFFALYYLVDTATGGGRENLIYLLIFTLLSAYRSGYLKNHAKNKLIASSLLFTLLLITQIRYGLDFFIGTIFVVFGTILILLVTALFLSEEIKKFIKLNHPEVLMLNSIPNLTDRDKNYLRSIFKGEKFAYIASSNYVTLGTVKNRMREIYKILGVADKTELLIRYNDYSE